MEPIFYKGVSLINKAFHSNKIRAVQDKIDLIMNGFKKTI